MPAVWVPFDELLAAVLRRPDPDGPMASRSWRVARATPAVIAASRGARRSRV